MGFGFGIFGIFGIGFVRITRKRIALNLQTPNPNLDDLFRFHEVRHVSTQVRTAAVVPDTHAFRGYARDERTPRGCYCFFSFITFITQRRDVELFGSPRPERQRHEQRVSFCLAILVQSLEKHGPHTTVPQEVSIAPTPIGVGNRFRLVFFHCR